MAKTQKGGKYGTNGGNGGYSMKKPVDMGLNKPLKLSSAGKFAATGKAEHKPK